jgi:L-ascorbate metabolism protein UlaG (beta-lactamase superfamily)
MSLFHCAPAGSRLERMQASPLFSGGTFRNPSGAGPGLKPGTALSTMGQFLLGGERRRPVAPLPSESPIERWTRPADSGLRATWLGHSTVLVEIDAHRVLTDPVWGERASPVGFAGPRRFQPVPVPVTGLPKLDAVIVSHDHYDHLDHGTILALVPSGVPFITSLGVGAHLESWGVPADRITELDWWQSVEIGGLTVTAAPSQHFSGRGLHDRNRTLWSSFAVRGPRRSFFFSGDTGLTPEYAEIRARLGPFDLVMLEVGAFHPNWGTIHLGPENALEALALLGGGSFLPVHWGTFDLGLHAWDEPAETLLTLASKRDVQLVMPRLGAPVEPTHADRVDTWWRATAALEKKEKEPAGHADAEPEHDPFPGGEPID